MTERALTEIYDEGFFHEAVCSEQGSALVVAQTLICHDISSVPRAVSGIRARAPYPAGSILRPSRRRTAAATPATGSQDGLFVFKIARRAP